MYDVKKARAICEERLAKALEEKNMDQVEQLQKLQEVLSKSNCLYGENFLNTYYGVVGTLKPTLKEVKEFMEYIESGEIDRGILYVTDYDGNELALEAMLDPGNEYYYRTGFGAVCKQRFIGDRTDFYELIDGRWVYDASLERQYIDTGYDCVSIRYELLPRE